MRSRGWCFTINNYRFSDIQAVVDLPYSYIVFGFEIGQNGIPHIQGYCYTENAISLLSISKLLKRAHIEKAGGTPQQNYDYCTKEGEFYEFGEMPQQGKRTDLDKLVADIKEGATLKQIEERYPKHYMMYKNKIVDMIRPLKKETKYYVIKKGDSKNETIQIIHQYFGELDNVAVVFSLNDLIDYDDYDNVILFPDEHEDKHDLYPIGYPLTIKYGYQRIKISIDNLIIVTETPKFYPQYKYIPN